MRHYHYDAICSTSDQAKLLSEQYPNQRLVVSADKQTEGRGRSGRSWASPVGGAWFSVVWPAAASQDTYHYAPLMIGLTVVGVVRQLLEQDIADSQLSTTNPRITVKWPNDVLVDGRKLAGVLCEWVARGTEANLIVGVGMNVNNSVSQINWDNGLGVTSLGMTLNRSISVEALIKQLVQSITIRIQRLEQEGFSVTARDELNAILQWVGDAVTVTSGHTTYTGELVGVDDSGHLILSTSQGSRTFRAGVLRQAVDPSSCK